MSLTAMRSRVLVHGGIAGNMHGPVFRGAK